MNERETFKFLGRNLGTGTGWDGNSSDTWQIYDFQPGPGVNLPITECLGINEIDGYFEIYDTDGNTTKLGDIIDILSLVPKA